jgi:oxalate decarboxylase/phosphoglucose isomerase-like protein (cupin superfamily)
VPKLTWVPRPDLAEFTRDLAPRGAGILGGVHLAEQAERDNAVETVHLVQGDVVVQRGTMHAWVNTGTQPCVFAFVLIDANPAEAGGRSCAQIIRPEQQ